jgi:hypothetical protein
MFDALTAVILRSAFLLFSQDFTEYAEPYFFFFIAFIQILILGIFVHSKELISFSLTSVLFSCDGNTNIFLNKNYPFILYNFN